MIGEQIEKEPYKVIPGGGTRRYHMISKDWILNEIFRRVEPSGRTMAEYFEEELQQKFGLEGIYLRYKKEELKKSFKPRFLSFREQLKNGRMKPENGGASDFSGIR